MTTKTQYWSIASDKMFMRPTEGDSYVSSWYVLNEQQQTKVAEAFDLWSDVSGFNAVEVYDNVDVARGASTVVNDGLFGLGDSVWQTTLQNDYSRIALADMPNSALGVNVSRWIGNAGPLDPHTTPGDNLYHEIYIDTAAEGSESFQLGSTAFTSLVHEIGHSVLGLLDPSILGSDLTTADRKHIDDSNDQAVMASSINNSALDSKGQPIWQPSTPMTLDIDYTSAIYGRATDTRTGDDTYGFNAFFSDGNYRPALDFNVNTRPLVTIFDNGGNDTLDASGFKDYAYPGAHSMIARPVQIDLNPGAQSEMLDGGHQTFAVIYKSTIWNTETWIENAIGGGADDKIYGNIKTNTLVGNDGDDILDGRGGADVMIGGAGDDTYYVDNYGDDVRELMLINARTGETRQDGIDKVIASVDHQLHDNVENLDLTGAAVLGIGNRLANVIIGNDNNNELYGLRGTDTLDGGKGADKMYGGADSDIYYVDNAGDQVVEYAQELDPDTGQTLDGGVDWIRSSVDITAALADNVEHLELLDAAIIGTGNELNNFVIGNDQNNRLYGLGGADTLIGGVGADYMSGGSGDDTYYVDNPADQIYEYNRFFGSLPHISGTDLVYSNTPDYTLSDQVENMTLLIDGLNGTGNALANVITGNDASNTLRGLGGADILDGGLGPDTLEGGDDDDTYYVDSIGDKVVEGSGAGSGIDLVYTTASTHTLAANVENLILLDGGLNGTGNGLVNIITGNEHANTLKGMGGADTLEGNGGADVLEGGAGDDILRGGEGADTLRGGADSDRADYSLAMDSVVVDLMQGGIGGEAAGDTYDSIEGVIGSEYADVIRGTDGADIIMGLGDGDIIEGRGGNDILTGGDPDYSNTFVFNRGWGQDTVTDFHVGMDHLDMSGISGLTSPSQLTITDTDQGARIAFEADTITLNGVTKVQLEASDSFVLDHPIAGTEGDFDIVYADVNTVTTGFHFALAGTGVEAVYGNAGNDVLDASGTSGYYTMLYGAGGDDVLIADSNGSYTLQGGPGNDTAVFAGNQADYTVTEGNFVGWPSWFTVTNKATGAVNWLQTVEHLQFTDGTFDAPVPAVTRMGTDAGEVLTAGDGAETIYGLGGNDVLNGSGGNDILEGGPGADQFVGGPGNDSFFIDNSDTLVDGGEGYDSVYADDTQGALAGLHFNLAGTSVEFAYGGMGKDVFDASGVSTSVELWGQWGDDVLTGGAGSDTLMGDEWLQGGGNDVLDGGAGNDELDGGNGDDTFVFRPGSGLDTIYDFGQAGDHDVIRFEGGLFGSFDALVASGAMAQSGGDVVITLDAESHVTIKNVPLSSLDATDFQFIAAPKTIIGVSGNNAIAGGTGRDTADYSGLASPGIVAVISGGGGMVNKGGGLGNDTLSSIESIHGSTASDVFYVDADATVTGGGGFDYLIELTPGVNVSYGTNFTGIAEFVSNTGNNTVDFSADPNVAYIYGSSGDDKLTLGTGGGYLFGGAGHNVLNGGTGATNVFVGGAGGSDVMNGGTGAASNFYYVDGNDQVNGAGTFNAVIELDAGVNVQLGSGQFLNVQEFVANGGNNTVSVVGESDFVYLYGGSGNDTLSTGSGGGYLFGQGGINTLNGGSGLNVFVADGASGVDVMNGGSGNNVYYIDANSTVHGAGTFNTVIELQQNVSLTLGSAQLGSNVQEIVLNGGTNTVDFSSAANSVYLYGAAGSDTLKGGAANDFLFGGAGSDTFVFQKGLANGDVVADFNGNGALSGDQFTFSGFGTAAQGATFTEVGTSDHWQIHSGIDGHNEVVTLQNQASVHTSDYLFV